MTKARQAIRKISRKSAFVRLCSRRSRFDIHIGNVDRLHGLASLPFGARHTRINLPPHDEAIHSHRTVIRRRFQINRYFDTFVKRKCFFSLRALQGVYPVLFSGKSACGDVMIRSKASGNAIGFAMYVFIHHAIACNQKQRLHVLVRKRMRAKG